MNFVRQPDTLVLPGIVLGLVLIALGALFWSPLLWVVGAVAMIIVVYHATRLYQTYLRLWAETRKESSGRV